MELPTLYSRNADQSIQSWKIEIDGARYRTYSGRVGGAVTSTAWTLCEAKNVGKKNEVSPEDQALAEAKAKWKKRIKSEGYREDVNSIDNLEYREPMRANSYGDRLHKITYPADAQFKLDGFRCNPQPDTNILLSRYNNPIVGVPHINQLLEKFHKQHPDIKLDGELYCHEHRDDFNALCSILRQQTMTPERIAKCQIMELWVFDFIEESLTWKERFKELKKLWKEWHSSFGRQIRLVWTTQVDDQAAYDAFHKDATSKGFEGTMLRQHDAKYVFRRCDGLLKRKDFIDAEFPIVKFLPGRGNKANMAAKVVLMGPYGHTFEANIVGDWNVCRDYLANEHLYRGKLGTVKFTNYTPRKADGSGGVPRQGELYKIDKF